MKIPSNPRVVLAGSVNSSKRVLEKMIEHKINVVSVFGLSPEASNKVSGYQDLKPIAEKEGIDFNYFDRINDTFVVDLLNKLETDLFFVVGLSQIIGNSLIKASKYGCIGFHPTKLPLGRGRAAIAWIILGEAEPAATFFKIDEGVDSGDILVSKSFTLKGDEYAQDVIGELLNAIDIAMDDVLPKIKSGLIELTPQDENQASYLEIRRPNDGNIDWSESAIDIHKLIRAVSRPFPGAFTYYQENKIIIWKANYHEKFNIKGVVGRIIKVKNDEFFVQTGFGVIEVLEYKSESGKEYYPKLGDKLGLDPVELIRQINLLRE